MVDYLKRNYDIDRPANVLTHPDPVFWVIETFKNYPSTLKIKEFMTDVLFHLYYSKKNL